ncbi:hypothetical protein [Saccharothrix deserti]|uniref:hypothetical protein n=1 Tax=Saccharothrix deserti TaxID=2593674 RepID=UPI00131D1417|nr:hypothetical protein [Saccharothrix deserti]
MTVNAYEKLTDFIKNLLTDEEFAKDFAEDQHGKLAAEGVTDHDLCDVDIQAAVREASASPEVPQDTRSALQSYTSGSSGPAQHSASVQQSVEQVVQHLNYITNNSYQDNDTITNLLDKSVNVDVRDSIFGGGLEVDAVTGEKGQIIDGDNNGQANTGDGAVLAGRDASGVNTGTNTGINAGGDVENAVVGDHNKTTQNSGDNSAVGGFGSGDTTNVSGNTQGDGSAIAVGGSNASGSNTEDNDTTVNTTVEDNDVTFNDNDVSGIDNVVDLNTVDNGTAFVDTGTVGSGGDPTFATQ